MGIVISWLALVIGGAAFAYARKLQQELNTATRRLDRYNRALFEANDEIRQLRQELVETGAKLRVELQQRTGTIAFQPETTVREAQLLHPQAQQILAGFHLGGCNSCAVEPDETLATVAANSGLEIDLLLKNLNLLVDRGYTQRNGTIQPVKIPNVELSL